MAASKTMVRMDVRERWVTIRKIAVPLKVGTAMAAEVVGVCVLTGICDLVFNESLFGKSMSVSAAFSTSNYVKIVEFEYARCECHEMRACLQFGVQSVRTAGKRVL